MKRIIFTLYLIIISLSLVDAQQVPGGNTVPGDSLVLFHDSGDPRFYDQSVVTQTTPSTVVTEAFDPMGTIGDKLPVVASPVKDGTNALKLQWNSGTGGDWSALVASIGWKAFDLTVLSHLIFWVNSPTAMDTTALPMLHLEAMAGIPLVTGKVRLADYVQTGLLANTWTQVSIPLTDFWSKDLLFQAKDTIKGVFFSQNNIDNMEHTLYLDEFTFTRTIGIDNPYATNKMNAYYTNGELRFAGYTGHVKVFDLIGRLLTEGNVVNGTFSIDLPKGSYLISTTEGSMQILLP